MVPSEILKLKRCVTQQRARAQVMAQCWQSDAIWACARKEMEFMKFKDKRVGIDSIALVSI